MVLWKYNVSDYFFPSFFLRQHSHSCSALKEKKKNQEKPLPPQCIIKYFILHSFIS